MQIFKNIEKIEIYTKTTYARKGDVYDIYHREDGPAYVCVYRSGFYKEVWYYDGVYHRYGGPSIITSTSKQYGYFIHGERFSCEVEEWLSERDYEWDTMSDLEKWELDLFMRTLE